MEFRAQKQMTIISMQSHSKGWMDCLVLERVDHNVTELPTQSVTLQVINGLWGVELFIPLTLRMVKRDLKWPQLPSWWSPPLALSSPISLPYYAENILSYNICVMTWKRLRSIAIWRKIKLDCYHISHTKMISKQIKSLNVKVKTVNVEKFLYNLKWCKTL